MRFIGHLDVMRYFQKAFRRAKIPVSYSQGYSPHQILSFTSPLGIGLTSDGEYMDMELTECPCSSREMVDWMNTQMNDEIRVKDFKQLPDDSKPSMAMLAGCDYVITLKPGVVSDFRDIKYVEKILADFLAQKEIVITKKTKRSEKETDIRPNLYYVSCGREVFQTMTGQVYKELCIDLETFAPVLFCQLTAGSVVNIKPELLLEAFCHFADVPYQPLDYQIHRLEMYGDLDGKKGEVHLLGDEIPCRLVPLSQYP
jgi:radical SAM-linked protein